MKRKMVYIALLMAVWLWACFSGSLPVRAEDGDTSAEIEMEADPVTVSDSNADPAAEDCLENYIQMQFDAAVAAAHPQTGPLLFRAARTAGSSLTGVNAIIYTQCCDMAIAVAAGERTSTVVSIPVEDLGLSQTAWTAEELGMESFDADGALREGMNRVMASLSIDLTRVVRSMLLDHPYEMYWYDKTAGAVQGGPLFGKRGDQLYMRGTMTFSFSVAEEYALAESEEDSYVVDPSTGAAVQTAVANAQAIAQAHAEESDLQKLTAYKDAICDRVSYNSAASGGGAPYGNPWQLVWVFDDDETTNVVCEGYAKAFQYLCDLSTFTREVSIFTVMGTMSGGTGAGGHMWNVAAMEDDKSYLIDVTNCDAGTVGASDKLFLKGVEAAEDGSYVAHLSKDITYVYDASMAVLFDPTDLVLSAEDYEEPVWEYHIRAVAATCEEEGHSAYYIDTEGIWYSDSGCTQVVTEEETVLPALGHSYGPWSTWDETYHATECAHDETHLLFEEHAWDEGTVTRRATYTEEGLMTYECEVCGERKTEIIEKIPVVAGWKKNSHGWWYQNPDGSYPANAWQQIDGKWYHFDAKGYMQTGWQQINGKWYWFKLGGAMATGWQQINGKWYWFKSGGAMATGWQQINGKWYWFKSGGSMATGWQQINGKWYWFKDSGAMFANGSKTINGKTYIFNASGVWIG